MAESGSVDKDDRTDRRAIMAEISQVEESLSEAMQRFQVIEKKLKTRLLTSESRERLEKELELVREVLEKNREQLKKLRKKNADTFAASVVLIIAIFLFYGLFSMWNNTD